MLPLDVASSFFAIAVLLALSPGPDNIFVFTQSLQGGRLAGLWATAGLVSGIMLHTAAVSLGAAALLAASPWLFNALKLLGAAYLLYLAWGAFKAATISKTPPNALNLSRVKLYFRGLIMNSTNPKVSLFFLAFLPQFTDPARGSIVQQIVLLGALFMLATWLVFGSIALLAAALIKRFSAGGQSGQTAQRWVNRLAAVVFVGLALKLLSAQI